MKSKPGNLERIKHVRFIYLIIIGIIVMFLLFFGRNSFLKVFLSHREVARLQSKVEQLQSENEQLRKENHELKTNPDEIEKIAREKLGYQKGDEKVFRFLPSDEETTTEGKK
jgi:cell division protein FtsL